MSTKIFSKIRQDIQSMHGYAIQNSDGMIKLDAMENPYSLPDALQAELGRRLGALPINRYPSKRVDFLKESLIKQTQLSPGYDLMLGNGSDELISLLAMACDLPNACILAPVPGFVMYAMSAQLQGLAFHGVPLTAEFELDEAAMLEAIQTHQPALLYLAYPNNPTANLWDEQVMDRLIQRQGEHGGLVVIDEAYQPFASKSYLPKIQQYPHLLLMRTLSKFGLAGVRIGYLLGAEALIAEINKVRPPYNVSILNAECAIFALEHQDVFAAQAQEICTQRRSLIAQLSAMPDVKVYPSEANMILVRVPNADSCFERLKAQGVLVKNVSKMHDLLNNCLRLTIGTPDENTQLLSALQASL
jgi:histidinol-phosphate aminotransferase